MLFTDDSVGRVLGGAARTTSDTNSRISSLILDFPGSSTFLLQLNLKQGRRRCLAAGVLDIVECGFVFDNVCDICGSGGVQK